jgi:hypothetical protein
MSINGFDDEAAPAVRRRRISLRFVAGSIVLGTVLGLLATIAVLVVTSRGQPPAMRTDAFEAAQERWKRHGLASYEMDIDESLGLTAKIHVEVRNDQVTAMTINGQPTAPRLWDSWSVPGLFGIIRLDLDRNGAVAGGEEQPPAVFQQAEFDPVDGHPRVYRRTELSGGQTVEWRITNFRPLN